MANISHFTQTVNGVSTTYDIHDANAVDLTNNQTVGGIKTFSNAPVVGSINLDGKTIDTDANGNMTYDGHIVDTIEEQGNGYIRYSNGLQICWGAINWQSACKAAWGSLYETSSIRESYAKSFAEIPSFSASGEIGTFSAIMESVGGNQASTPYIYLIRATAVNSVMTCTARYIAIGRWK